MQDDRGRDIRAIGNGRVLAYLTGAGIRTMFGPRYSSPHICSTDWSSEGEFAISADDAPGLAAFRVAGTAAGELQVFAEPAVPAVTYLWRDLPGRELTITPGGAAGDPWRALAITDADDVALITEIPRGAPVFAYPSSAPHYIAVVGRGFEAAANHELRITTREHGELSLLTGVAFDEVRDQAAALLSTPVVERRRQAVSRALAAARTDVVTESRLLPAGLGELERTADQILAQQSDDGGIIAGHDYPLAYVRDQFGTCEGLLALGLTEPVRRNILFRYAKWERYGDIANAEAMSDETLRHRHESDEVEQTGYTVLQILRYARASGDAEIVRTTAPMIEWCLAAQSRHLVHGALPFNGDETYIAGGLLPRWALNDGSLEATLLYYAAIRAVMAERLMLGRTGIPWDRLEADAESCRRYFRENFVRNGSLITNSLARRDRAPAPQSRDGVCENCGSIATRVVRNAMGRYTCWRCDEAVLEPPPRVELQIASAGLLAAAIPNDLVPPSVLQRSIDDAYGQWAVGRRSPVLGPRRVSVGYDEGFLVRGLIGLGDWDRARDVAGALLGRRDRNGMWSEYYDDAGAQTGTRCRPWETGLNIAALLSAPSPDDGTGALG